MEYIFSLRDIENKIDGMLQYNIDDSDNLLSNTSIKNKLSFSYLFTLGDIERALDKNNVSIISDNLTSNYNDSLDNKEDCIIKTNKVENVYSDNMINDNITEDSEIDGIGGIEVDLSDYDNDAYGSDIVELNLSDDTTGEDSEYYGDDYEDDSYIEDLESLEDGEYLYDTDSTDDTLDNIEVELSDDIEDNFGNIELDFSDDEESYDENYISDDTEYTLNWDTEDNEVEYLGDLDKTSDNEVEYLDDLENEYDDDVAYYEEEDDSYESSIQEVKSIDEPKIEIEDDIDSELSSFRSKVKHLVSEGSRVEETRNNTNSVKNLNTNESIKKSESLYDNKIDSLKNTNNLTTGVISNDKILNKSPSDYSHLGIDNLYNLVAVFMKMNGVKTNGISQELLVKKFGADNIKKLISKSYLISLPNGTLTFNK